MIDQQNKHSLLKTKEIAWRFFSATPYQFQLPATTYQTVEIFYLAT